ncbi:hypothetical protein LIER_24881 [Lithospermum erythrorhizon]|uniref:DUF4378 domain-containing protein n=1 Tax=Lithospermum erythrorhizon TaxID=34254 RepID=A0AAV3R611_LITER
MAMKSDFAQKLLTDLRRRKEQIAVAGNSGNTNSKSLDAYGRSAQTFRGSGQTKALDSIGKKGGNSLQSSARGNRSFNHEASSSNQIVPYGKGKIPDERSDLSMIFSLAFGNGSKVDISGNSALIKFLNQIGTRPLDIKAKKKTDIGMGSQLSSTPISSSFHITEISKGVEKLKQVIKAYPNGLDLNGRSTQAGRELLKGAMDLEQSLRMLVNLQEASDQKSNSQRKVKIRLLDEDEEDGDGRKAIIQADPKKQVDRPRFSFDKPSNKNSQGNKDSSANNYIKKHLMALTLPDETPKSDRKIETTISASANMKARHKRSVSVPEFRKPMLPETRNQPVSPFPTQEKGRISNVIAKLMGLEALPQNENKHTEKELSSKTNEGLVSKTNLRDVERRPTIIDKRVSENKSVEPLSKGFRSALESSIFSPFAAPTEERIVYNEHKKPHNLQAPAKNYAAALIGRESTANTTERKPRHSIGPSVQFSSGYCANYQGQVSEAKGKEDKEKIRETKKLILSTEPQNQVHQKNTSKSADNCESQGAKTIGKASETGIRSTSRIQTGKQQNPYSNREMQHLKRPKEIERQEDKSQVQKRKQYLERQKLLAGGRKISPTESAISSETNNLYRSSRNTQPNLGQEEQKESKFLRPSGTLMPAKDLSHNRDHEKNVQQETLSKATFTLIPPKELSRHGDHENNVQQDTPSKLSVIQRTTDDGNTCMGGTKDKLDSVLNGKGKENVASPIDQPLVIHEIIKESRNKIDEEGTKLHKYQQYIEPEVADDHPKKSIDQPLNVKVTTHIEAIESTKLCSLEEEGELQEISKKFPSNVKDLEIEAGVAFNDNCHEGQPAVSEYIELKQEKQFTDQQTETCVEQKNWNKILDAQRRRRTLLLGIEEQLTESEELLKQKLTKSRYFLNTAEALLKLNIPVRILIGHDDKVQDIETKLALDCSYELLKWKGKKHELNAHPYSCVTNNYKNRINSFRDLIKQLCKDFDTLKLYGGNVDSESDVADVLHTMLEKDIQHDLSDVSFMWDHGWGELTFSFLEKDDIIKEMEKHMLNGLLNEITIDLLDFASTI